MYCKKCGNRTAPDARFCNSCGQPVDVLINDSSQYAGFWIRSCALVFDSLLLLIPQQWVSFLMGADNHDFWFVEFVMSLAMWWIYTAGLQSSSWQATLGKKLLGLKVVDNEGARISFGRATGRYFASFLSAILLCIGYIMVAFTEKKQALHDQIAGTLVVRSRPK